jgi:hypothetical protein
MKSRLAAVTAIVLAVLTAFSCATSSGTLVDRVADAETPQKKTPPTPPPTSPPDDGEGWEHWTNPDGSRIWIKDRYHGTTSLTAEGLAIRTDPEGAEVWLNSSYQGTTPLTIEGLRKGTYRLLITLEGYREVMIWLDYSGEPMVYEISLVPILGYVDLDVTPDGAEVMLGDRRLRRGITPIPIGSYSVKASAFGYTEWRSRVRVYENAVTPITVDLAPAAFAVATLSIARTVVNPRNPGLIGFLDARFDVTAPGSGSAAVFDRLGQEVHQETLPEFTAWSQRWTWRPPDAIPDGEYSIVISGLGRDGLESRKESRFTVDRTMRTTLRSSWSGGSGLLYVPAAEALPPQSVQAGLIGVAFYDPLKGLLQAPVQLSVRTGLGSDLELDASIGAILTGSTPPVVGSVSIRWAFLQTANPVALRAAVEAKAALQSVPMAGILTTDTFANFSGLSLGVPIQLTLGPVSLLAEPAIIGSGWQVDYDSEPATSASPAAWMYWRAGLMLDTGAFVAGISASARSNPLPDGFLSIDLPVQAGLELHLLLPGTHILVGGVLAGEFEGPTEWYLMGGISLGVLF